MRQSVDANGAQTNYTYDAMGRLLTQTNPFPQGMTPGPVTTYQYDLLGRVTTVTQPGGNTMQTAYSGSVVTNTDQVHRKMTRESDGLGRLIKVTEPDASGALTQETSYTYDAADRLTLVNQGNQTRAFKYDAEGHLLFERIPEQNATVMTPARRRASPRHPRSLTPTTTAATATPAATPPLAAPPRACCCQSASAVFIGRATATTTSSASPGRRGCSTGAAM